MLNEQNLNLYRIFYETAACRSLSLAARKLYISQPAISKSIKKLEQHLNTSLFIRSSRGAVLTEAGEILYRHVKEAFEALDFGESQLKRMNELGIGHLRIGVSTTLCKYVLLPFLKNFVSRYPHVKISIQCQSTNHTLKLLEENKIDIGLIGKPENIKTLDFFSLGEIHDVFVSTPAYLDFLQLRESCNLDNLIESATLMLLDQENMTRQYIDHYINEHQIKPANLLEVSSMDLLIEFAKTGIGVGCVIKEFILEDLKNKKLIEIPLGMTIDQREIGFCHSKKLVLTDAIRNFIEFYSAS